MIDLYLNFIAGKMQIASWQVSNCVALLEEGATVPFISRYRKERTGTLDEVQVSEAKHWQQLFVELEKRKEAILTTIEGLGKLTPELKKAIDEETDPRTLEDLYLPYRPKRRTRASIAKEKGLEPLADAIWEMRADDPSVVARGFVSKEADGPVPSVDEALAGARDILAERMSEETAIRSSLRDLYTRWGTIVTCVAKGKEADEAADKYRNYFEFSERLDKIPSHRLLAILRGVGEEALSAKVEVKEEYALERIARNVYERGGSAGRAAGGRVVADGRPFRRPSPACKAQIDAAMADSYKRLLHPSIENESLSMAKERADIEAIRVFGENLRQLLLAAPVGQKRTMAIDPGFRTGCKVVCLDAQGGLLCHDVIYPHPPVSEKIASMKKIGDLVSKYNIEVIAIGNGTAGRETEEFIAKMGLEGVKVFSVSEDGASVYSASETAREEFPQYDVTVRGAVSIGRRLMDPLAELVKIDPKSIGVGQYQHDVDQALLKETLDSAVEACVNTVGVNLNTASRYLLSYVSGIGPSLAQNIVDYRSENGAFTSRKQLLKVKRLGDKVFEQCAGFLRIPGAANPLDNSAVHPERYALVEQMARDISVSVPEPLGDSATATRAGIDLSRYVTPETGLPTLNDILAFLAKPGLDPRESADEFAFSDEIRTIEDLRVGMVLPCIVSNITAFGAFVDLGIHDKGLIHVSQICEKYITSPSEVLKLNQRLQAKVISVDVARRRIGLSLK